MTMTEETYDLYNYPNTGKLDKFDGPYILDDPSNENPVGFFRLELPTFIDDDIMLHPDQRTMFYMVGGELVERSGVVDEVHLQLRHSWATDLEHDRAYVASLVLQNFQVEHYYGHRISCSGWLTEARFYPENLELEGYPEGFNPFVGAVRAEDDMDNNNYPYQPARISWDGAFKLPIRVQVEYYPNRLNARLDVQESLQRIKQEQADREEEQARKREAAAAKKARREEEHARWLLTEEGQASVVLDKFNNMMKVIFPVRVVEGQEHADPETVDNNTSWVVDVFTRSGDGDRLRAGLEDQMRYIRYPAWREFCEAVIKQLS